MRTLNVGLLFLMVSSVTALFCSHEKSNVALEQLDLTQDFLRDMKRPRCLAGQHTVIDELKTLMMLERDNRRVHTYSPESIPSIIVGVVSKSYELHPDKTAKIINKWYYAKINEIAMNEGIPYHPLGFAPTPNDIGQLRRYVDEERH